MFMQREKGGFAGLNGWLGHGHSWKKVASHDPGSFDFFGQN